MKYFSSLPLLTQKNNVNDYIVYTNILTRNYFLPKLKNNIMLFYNYDIQENDTPESIAYKYYGNSYNYWLILYANNILDPFSDWPLSGNQLSMYLFDKYKAQASNALSISANTITVSEVLSYLSLTPHHYEKIITTTDSTSMQNTVIKINIDFDTYSSLVDSTTTKTFTSGDDIGVTVKKTVQKNAVSIYQYEVDLNESKRTINIMKDTYVSQAEIEFVNLMSS